MIKINKQISQLIEQRSVQFNLVNKSVIQIFFQVHGMGSGLGIGVNGGRSGPGGRLGPARRNMDWTDTPEDVFFMATDNTRSVTIWL